MEVANAGARLILQPDWEPITWTETERKKGQAWGLKTIPSFHTHGTPPWRTSSLRPLAAGEAAFDGVERRHQLGDAVDDVVCAGGGEL